VARLLGSLRWAGAQDQVTALLARDPAAHAAFHDPDNVAFLLNVLWREDAYEQAVALEDLATAYIPLDDPGGVASLLDSLWREGGTNDQAFDQVTALLARDPAAHAAFDDPLGVARLLDSLRREGAHDQATALEDRLPGAGMFQHYLEQGHKDQFRFGRKADGSTTTPLGLGGPRLKWSALSHT
jgi:hypothetical protein